MEKRGEFPKRVQLSPQRKGYRTSDLKKWVGGVK
jgi:predicted DNA-binding transcriptional regulator AlpA